MLKDVTAEIKSNAPKEAHLAANDRWLKTLLRPHRLLVAAAVFHLVITVMILVPGRFATLTGVFYRNGIAIALLPNAIKARPQASPRRAELTHGHIRVWFP